MKQADGQMGRSGNPIRGMVMEAHRPGRHGLANEGSATTLQRKATRTRRLELRALVAGDYAPWLEAETSAASGRSKFDGAPRSPEQCSRAEFKRVRARHRRLAQEDNVYVFGVFLRRSGALVGMIDIGILHRRRLQLGNLGYRVFPLHRRRGYAREAVLAAMHAAFGNLELNRLEAVIDPNNRPSVRLARALGMRREGVRHRYYFQNGRFEDQVVWTAQREDYGHPPLIPRLAQPKRQRA